MPDADRAVVGRGERASAIARVARLKRPWPDGRTELVLPPVAFLRRLCGIIRHFAAIWFATRGYSARPASGAVSSARW